LIFPKRVLKKAMEQPRRVLPEFARELSLRPTWLPKLPQAASNAAGIQKSPTADILVNNPGIIGRKPLGKLMPPTGRVIKKRFAAASLTGNIPS
jgi:hypothetical protein